jgi:hypothetical protein
MEHRHKGRFRILHAKTGELLATYFCEEDHRAVDVQTLGRALPQYECKNISIAKVVWDDYDEVTVFVKAKKVPEGQKKKVKEKRAKARGKRRKRRISKG